LIFKQSFMIFAFIFLESNIININYGYQD